MSKLSEELKQKILDGRKIWEVEIKQLIAVLERLEAELAGYREAEQDGEQHAC